MTRNPHEEARRTLRREGSSGKVSVPDRSSDKEVLVVRKDSPDPAALEARRWLEVLAMCRKVLEPLGTVGTLDPSGNYLGPRGRGGEPALEAGSGGTAAHKPR